MLHACPECRHNMADTAPHCPNCGYTASSQFREFEDRDYADWKRVRTAIEHENTLVNHRLTWLFASQGFLFAAVGAILNAQAARSAPGNTLAAEASLFSALLFVIPLLGVVVCLLVWRGLLHAEIQLRRLDRWWHTEDRSQCRLQDLEVPYDRHDPKRAAAMEKKLAAHPPVQGESQTIWDQVISANTIPIFFIGGWAVMMLAENRLGSGALLVLLTIGVVWDHWRQHYRSPVR